jgi:hypothetical protein
MVSEHYFDLGGYSVALTDLLFKWFLLSGVFVSCALSTPGQSRDAQGSNNDNQSPPSVEQKLEGVAQKVILSS